MTLGEIEQNFPADRVPQERLEAIQFFVGWSCGTSGEKKRPLVLVVECGASPGHDFDRKRGRGRALRDGVGHGRKRSNLHQILR